VEANTTFDFHDAVKNFKKFQANYDDYNYIPAVKYRDVIKDLCSGLAGMEDINLLCPAIALSNNSVFYTSNNPDLAITYMSSGMYRADNYFNFAMKSTDSVIFPGDHEKKIDFLHRAVLGVLQEQFSINNLYCLIRRCDDCIVIIAVTSKYPVEDARELYARTVDTIEDITIDYFNKLISIYVEQLPMLRHSRFTTDSQYRKKIIKHRSSETEEINSLTNKERECLYWISRGKTSSEIGILMEISEHTVNEHKKSLLKKLSVSNMVHAVREAIKLGLIL
jgi:DNA-binding CsgD family transcriptional regulator